MSPEAKRSGRIQELTKMAINGKSWESIKIRAYQMASKKTANEYLEEVDRRIQIINSKRSQAQT